MDNFFIKKIFWCLLNLLLAVVIMFCFRLYSYATYKQDNIYPTRVVVADAEGKVVVVPDVAKFNVSVVSEGIDVKKITDENAKKMNAIIAFIKEKGVADKDIQTTGYDLSPKYSYSEKTGESYIYAYSLANTANVKIRDFNVISDVMGGLLNLGANRIGHLYFDIDEQDKYFDKARQKAFEKAHQKAETMADLNGVKLGRLIAFSASPNEILSQEGRGMYKEMMALDVSVAPPTIEKGSQEITAVVSVTYEME